MALNKVTPIMISKNINDLSKLRTLFKNLLSIFNILISEFMHN